LISAFYSFFGAIISGQKTEASEVSVGGLRIVMFPKKKKSYRRKESELYEA
jgi:hypothetical protein